MWKGLVDGRSSPWGLKGIRLSQVTSKYILSVKGSSKKDTSLPTYTTTKPPYLPSNYGKSLRKEIAAETWSRALKKLLKGLLHSAHKNKKGSSA